VRETFYRLYGTVLNDFILTSVVEVDLNEDASHH
jgi:hypothetical protein